MIQTRNTERRLKKEIFDQGVKEKEIFETSHMRAELAAAQLLSETNRQDLQMLSFANENEKILKDSQAFQLRSLMGNVAHDLKVTMTIIIRSIIIYHCYI
jgi:hypothetical protein